MILKRKIKCPRCGGFKNIIVDENTLNDFQIEDTNINKFKYKQYIIYYKCNECGNIFPKVHLKRKGKSRTFNWY